MSMIAAYMVPHPPMIIPEVGRGSEAQIEATRAAYMQVAEEIAALKPDTIILSSPHATMYADYFHISPGKESKGSFAQFHAPQVHFQETYDEALVQAIERKTKENNFPAGTLGQREKALDHGTMVPLYFIRKKYTNFKLVRIGLSGLPLEDHYRLGQIIQRAVGETERRVVYIASGDLSHKLQSYGPYGFAAEGPVYDARIMDVCSRAAFGELFDFDETFCEHAAECGHRSFVIMAGALDGMAVEAKQLSHEDVTGVGYGICTFHPKGANENRHFLAIRHRSEEKRLTEARNHSDAWVSLARESVESYVLHHQVMNRANLAEEIIRNAVSAAVNDPRFNPIQPEELKWLEINVDVLSEPEGISSEDELDIKRYGVIVTKGQRRGLLLPDLDGVDTVQQQVAIARKKAGIGPDEKVSLQRFEVVRHT